MWWTCPCLRFCGLFKRLHLLNWTQWLLQNVVFSWKKKKFIWDYKGKKEKLWCVTHLQTRQLLWWGCKSINATSVANTTSEIHPHLLCSEAGTGAPIPGAFGIWGNTHGGSPALSVFFLEAHCCSKELFMAPRKSYGESCPFVSRTEKFEPNNAPWCFFGPSILLNCY